MRDLTEEENKISKLFELFIIEHGIENTSDSISEIVEELTKYKLTDTDLTGYPRGFDNIYCLNLLKSVFTGRYNK